MARLSPDSEKGPATTGWGLSSDWNSTVAITDITPEDAPTFDPETENDETGGYGIARKADDAPPAAPESIEDFLARVQSGIKARRVRFYFGGRLEWADLLGGGASADQMRDMDAAMNGEDSVDLKDAEKQTRTMASVISSEVAAWSFPVPPTYEALCKMPVWFLSKSFQAIQNADTTAPLDHQPKGKGKRKKS